MQAPSFLLGLARQAAWVATGQRPDWPVETIARLEPAPDAALRARYAAAEGLAREAEEEGRGLHAV